MLYESTARPPRAVAIDHESFHTPRRASRAVPLLCYPPRQPRVPRMVGSASRQGSELVRLDSKYAREPHNPNRVSLALAYFRNKALLQGQYNVYI
jgi:hypothetical protein